MAKAKSKSLLGQTSTKKKENKYSEVSPTKREYKYSPKEEVIYLGLNNDYKGLPCTIIKKSRAKSTEYYNVRFEDNEELNSVSCGFLKTPEEYEQWLSDQENEEMDIRNNMSEVELEMIKAGLISHKNYLACLSPIVYSEMRCFECGYETRCVYRKKHDYKKLNLK